VKAKDRIIRACEWKKLNARDQRATRQLLVWISRPRKTRRAIIASEEPMKSTGGKPKKDQPTMPVSRDKVRNARDNFRIAESKTKNRVPLADRRSETRAKRRLTKGALKQLEDKLNP
jgi:hypothetical protein